MNTTIQNEYLSVSIRAKGAELTDITDKKDKVQHLFQADEQWWGWHAPVLFPKIGESVEKKIRFNDKVFEMEKHGFARYENFILIESHAQSVKYQLENNERTISQYPFHFLFTIEYVLHKNQLKCIYSVGNTGKVPLPFTFGGHPAFSVPFFENEQLEDYYIEFEKKETIDRHLIDDNGLFNGETERVLTNESIIPLTADIFLQDALIFKNHISKSVKIKSRNHKKSLHVRFDDFPYLGIWAKPGAPYVCIEPWIGCAENAGESLNFEDKEKCIILESGKTFSCSFEIIIA